ncbi:MAG: histidine phosphatase family protein [Streptococcaceae bacterium]|jgi:probable phosphoglycerate mutase|nr:histidine phosphatase family protein [Streptococcaceae bacterium]
MYQNEKNTLFNAPLTNLGKKQAQIASNYYQDKQITFTNAYSSTQERASDTLELLVDMPYTRLKGLKERDFGLFEGESEDLNPPLPYGDYFKTYGGEAEEELTERIITTLKEVMDKNGNESVLAVSHGAILAVFYRYWEKYAEVKKTERFGNCCILEFEYENEIFTLKKIINHDFSSIV